MTYLNTQRIHAVESLERWEVQIEDLMQSGVFGEHTAEKCLWCRAQSIVEQMKHLRELLGKRTVVPSVPGSDASGCWAAFK